MKHYPDLITVGLHRTINKSSKDFMIQVWKTLLFYVPYEMIKLKSYRVFMIKENRKMR